MYVNQRILINHRVQTLASGKEGLCKETPLLEGQRERQCIPGRKQEQIRSSVKSQKLYRIHEY